jgi:BCL2-associated athanogene 2
MMEWQGGADSGSGTRLPQVVEPNEGSQQKSPKSKLVNLLDEVEMHVERLRRDALKLEEEKDRLLTTLDSLRNSEIMIDLGDSKYTSLWGFWNSFRVHFLYSHEMSKVM